MDQFTGMGDENLHMSDVIEVIQKDENGATIVDYDDMQVDIEEEIPRNSFSPMMTHPLQNESHRPYIEILEQPASGIRFRYEIEGRSAGSIPGEHSRPDMKTYPTVRIVGYTGKMLVVVSCVTVEDNPKNRPKPHPHKLVGRVEHCKNGVCRVRLRGDNMTVSFPNLGIQCVRRKDVEASLSERQREKVDPFGTGFDHKKSHANLALNAVRLCFQGFIPRKIDGKIVWQILDPVVSNPIIEKKATCTLSIHKLSHYCASVGGGMEMILLCDKVPKDDIQIRFYEERDGLLVWEGYGDFQPTQVHHQYAIAFRTPKYDNPDIKEPVKVNIQLKLKSKEQYGPSLDFEMLPLANLEGTFHPKRKSPMDLVSEYTAQNPEKHKTLDFGSSGFKMLDPSLQNFIKVEPRHSPYSMIGESLSPNPHCSTSPLPPLNFQPYNIKSSPAHSPPMPPIYNIPCNQNPSNLQNRYEFPQTAQADSQQNSTMVKNVLQNLYLDFPSHKPCEQVVNNVTLENAEGVSYQTPNQLNFVNKDAVHLLDLDNQQYLNSAMNFRTSDILDSVLDEKFSKEFDNRVQISDPTPQPEQLNEMTDSLTRLTRDIESLNEMYKPNLLD